MNDMACFGILYFYGVFIVIRGVPGDRPELRLVFDLPNSGDSKHTCPDVFAPRRDLTSGEGTSTSPASACIPRSERGGYYKNVRYDWASLVTTPPSARYGFFFTL